MRATADHRILKPRFWVEWGDLQVGDKIHVQNRKGGFGNSGSLEEGRVLGWLIGDDNIKFDAAVLSFFGEEKQELAPMFAGYVEALAEPLTSPVAMRSSYSVGVIDIPTRDEARVQSERLRRLVADYGLTENNHQVSESVFRGTEEMHRGFLLGLCTLDGSFQDTGEKGAIVCLAANQMDLLESVQQLLSNFRIASRIYVNRRPAGERMLLDGNGSLKAYS